ncbi:MAG: hypothetical protein MUP17_06485 [candidate division Zixibacteria bacterium]|nr:hypothetical protein [candidate division Zixibacteria bacterium]
MDPMNWATTFNHPRLSLRADVIIRPLVCPRDGSIGLDDNIQQEKSKGSKF